MEVFLGIENLPDLYRNSVICIGNFDGIHYGHHRIVKDTIILAKKNEVKSLMVTFDRHPRIVFAKKTNRQPVKVLNTIPEKNRTLKKTGLDAVLYLRTENDFFSINPEEFIKKIIVDNIDASIVIVGYDFRFGKNRKGNVELMQSCGQKYGFQVRQMKAVKKDGDIVSSSIIRKYLETGKLEQAVKMLGRNYRLSGRVVHGSGRGRDLGFPTANVAPDNLYKLVPGIGIYLVRLQINGEVKFGLCNIGVRPTFDEEDLKIEIYIYDNKEKDRYGQDIEVEFIQRIRDEIRFDSTEKLIKQMEKDKILGLKLIKQYNLD